MVGGGGDGQTVHREGPLPAVAWTQLGEDQPAVLQGHDSSPNGVDGELGLSRQRLLVRPRDMVVFVRVARERHQDRLRAG